MSWWSKNISEPFQSAASAYGRGASYVVTYSGAAVALVGGAVTDIVDKTVEGAGYVAGKDWDLYENSASVAVINYVADGKANELADYIHTNPGHAGHVAAEGVQQGVGTVAGLAGGVVAGTGGLLVDVFNQGVRNVTFGQFELYEGGFTAASAGFSKGSSIVKDGFVDLTDLAMSDPTMRNEHDRIIFGATKGATETGAFIAAIAATGGAGAALLGGNGLAVARGVVTSSYNTKILLASTVAGTGFAMNSSINEQAEKLELRKNMLRNVLGGADVEVPQIQTPVNNANLAFKF